MNIVATLASLVSEDLASVPGPALSAAEEALCLDPGDDRARRDACLAALAAGEPKRALSHLGTGLLPARTHAAVTAWARQLDTNRYPGRVGAEGADDLTGMFVDPVPGEPVVELLEQLVANGPMGLSTPRTLLEVLVRQGDALGMQQVLGAALRKLDSLAEYAGQIGRPDIRAWTAVIRADFFRRAARLADADRTMAAARTEARTAGEDVLLAYSHLVEGDWYAAPGSAPESLGWPLAPQELPSPLPPPDYPRAATCYERATEVLDATAHSRPAPDLPRFRSALGLRRALLARATGDPETTRAELDRALAAARTAGDAAAYHLAAMHLLVADIDEGRLARHALDLGGGWHPPAYGPVAELLAWEHTVGSRSWCLGLGRLLERCAQSWAERGDASRARVGYLAALHLISVTPSVPSRQLVTQVAAADARHDLDTSALLRLEREFGAAFAGGPEPVEAEAVPGNDGFALAQQLEAAQVLVGALDTWGRGPAAPLAAGRLASIGEQLRRSADRLAAPSDGSDLAVPRTVEELQATVAVPRGDGSLEASTTATGEAMALLHRMQLDVARTTVTGIEVLVPTIRARSAEQAGRSADAERFVEQAVEAARREGAEPHLLPLALVAGHRLQEAREALDSVADVLDDDVELLLRMRTQDHEGAARLLDHHDPTAPRDWRDSLARAETWLALGRTEEAQRAAEVAIAAFEELLGRLVRDPERVAAADQPDVAALFSTLARTHLARPGTGTAARKQAEDGIAAAASLDAAGASFAAAERVLSLTGTERLQGADPLLLAAWQRSAAEYAASSGRLLSTLTATGPEDRQPSFARLDAADGALARAEHALEASVPGLLAAHARPTSPATADLRRLLPAGTVILEYLAVGEDLLAWALTTDTLRPVHRTVRFRKLTATVRAFHGACAEGGAGGGTAGKAGERLAAWLLGPFDDLLREHPRVVVVPFGPLHAVPFHALRLDGVPLALSHVVSYAPRAAAVLREDRPLDRPAALHRPLVVADPAFDRALRPALADLPGSRVEGSAVGARLEVAPGDVLVGEAATEEAVAIRLEGCDLLHLSGHGHLDELSPYASSLVLAGPDALTIADIAGLRFGTELAVLTGCDTGCGTAALGGGLVGLTRSLLRGGVDRTVVPLWPVDDVVAPVVMDLFYVHLATGNGPAVALAQAQRAVHAMDHAALRTAYRDLGGDPDRTAERRRGVWLDPALQDAEVPEPLGGDAERYWAPFVLVG